MLAAIESGIGDTTTTPGSVNTSFLYTPFGEVLEASGNEIATHRRRWNDKHDDELSKLSYYGVRYYDATAMTWTQADPQFRLAPDAAWNAPRKASLYAFSLQNPVRYIDPDGRQPVPSQADFDDTWELSDGYADQVNSGTPADVVMHPMNPRNPANNPSLTGLVNAAPYAQVTSEIITEVVPFSDAAVKAAQGDILGALKSGLKDLALAGTGIAAVKAVKAGVTIAKGVKGGRIPQAVAKKSKAASKAKRGSSRGKNTGDEDVKKRKRRRARSGPKCSGGTVGTCSNTTPFVHPETREPLCLGCFKRDIGRYPAGPDVPD